MPYNFLHELSLEKPFIVLDNMIILQGDSTIVPSARWNNDYGELYFEESESILDLERMMLRDNLSYMIQVGRKKKADDVKVLSKKSNSILDDKMNVVLLKYVTYNIGDEERKKIFSRYSISNDDMMRISQDPKVKELVSHNASLIHNIGEKEIKGYLFFYDTCFGLYDYKSSKKSNNGAIIIGNRAFNLSPEIRSNDIIKRYRLECEKKITQLAKSENKKYDDIYDRIIKSKSQKLDDLEIGKKGFVKEKDCIFVYAIKDYYKIRNYNSATEEYYGFPGCKLGLIIRFDGSSYQYDTPVRIFRSKKINNGKEDIESSFYNAKEVGYNHPGTYKDQSEYPKLCVNSKSLSFLYTKKIYNNPDSFVRDINSIINDSISSIEHGLWYKDIASGRIKESTVYRSLTDKKFENNRIRNDYGITKESVRYKPLDIKELKIILQR